MIVFLQAIPTITLPETQLNGWSALVLVTPALLAFFTALAASIIGLVNGQKTSNISGMLNGELAKFKQDYVMAHEEKLRTALDAARMAADREKALAAAGFEVRIARLEADLKNFTAKLLERPPVHVQPIAVAVEKVVPVVPEVVVEPERHVAGPTDRLEEIRGQL